MMRVWIAEAYEEERKKYVPEKLDCRDDKWSVDYCEERLWRFSLWMFARVMFESGELARSGFRPVFW